MDERAALAENVRALLLQTLDAERPDWGIARYNLEDLRRTVMDRLQAGRPESSRSLLPQEHHPLAEVYWHVARLFMEIEPLLQAEKKEQAIEKIEEAIRVLVSYSRTSVRALRTCR